MIDQVLNDRLTALSGKLDRVLTREATLYQKDNDVLARIARIEQALQLAHPAAFPRKLGRKTKRVDERTLKLSKYLSTTLPPVPVACDWTSGITSWGMMENDTLGDCTIAAAGHLVMAWTAAVSSGETVRQLPDSVIQDYYSAWCGYVPGDSSTDNGGVEIDILNNWRKYGFGLRANRQGQDRLAAYVSVNPGNLDEVKQAIALFGGLYIGLQLPTTAQGQLVWDVVGDGSGDSAPGSWGGHAVPITKYSQTRLTCVTWGALLDMTNEFWAKYVDECYALLSFDFLNKNEISPGGIDFDTLRNDLQQVTA